MPSKIAAYLDWAPQTVRETIHRWNTKGLGGLWEAPGRGGKPKWQEADIAYLEKCLETEPRTYNSRQLAQKLASERQVSLSPDRIRRVLKKRGCMVRGLVRVIGISKTRSNENSNKLTWRCWNSPQLLERLNSNI